MICLELRVLQYFLAVVREGNISKAAETLHITQPTLSRQMSQLEEELGVQLFIRGRHLTLTDAGVMLRHRAEEVIALMDRIDSEFQEQNMMEGVISIGSGGLKSLQSLMPVVKYFSENYPNVQFQFHTNNADHIKDLLDKGLLDFGLLLEPVDVAKYDFIRFEEKERWGLLIERSHPLANKEFIVKDDLLDLNIATTDRVSVQRELEQWLGESSSDLRFFATYNVITNVVGLVHSGIAAALTIEGAVNLLQNDELAFIPLYPELSMPAVLAWKKFQPNFGAAAHFIEQYKNMQNKHIDI